MKKIVFLVGLLYSTLSFSQLTNSSNVIASSGSEISNSNLQISFTIGETFTSTFTGSSVHCLGFQQGDLFVASIVTDNKEELLLYPNPASEQITLETTLTSSFSYHVYDVSGRIVLSGVGSGGSLILNLNSVERGNYIIEYIPKTGASQYLPFITL